MSQAGIINVIENNPTIPIVFDADTGSAMALFNVINIVGAGGITTSASGNTITISGSTFAETITGQTGGPLSPTAGNWNIFGSSVAAGTTPVATSGSVSTLTVNVQRSQAIVSTNASNVGLAAFNSAQFIVDPNGFVSLTAAGPFVTSVSGTLNRITSTGGTTPVIDIAATYVGQTSITTLGTIITGVWNGTAIGPTFGGTGQTTYTTGDTLYASAANTLSKLSIGSAAQVLTVSGGIPSWQTPTTGTVTSVSGTLNRITSTGGNTPVIDISAAYVGQTSITTLGTVTTGTWNAIAIGATFGGTGQTTYVTGDTLYASAANTLSKLSVGSNGQVLTLAAGIPSWATPTTGTVTSVSGTLNRITSTGGSTPVIDIDAAYVGQTSITTLGTITTGVWNGTAVDATHGGTAQTTWATGDILYASGVNTLAKLAAGSNTQVLTLAAGVPTWAAAAAGTVTSVSGTTNRITSTGGATPVIDISASYVGQSSITTLGTITTGVWNGTVIDLAHGGTNANLTASNGGVFYSTATAGAILSGTATANKVLMSGATAAPTWSTPTFPNASATSGKIIISDGTNWIASTPTYPATAGTSGNVLTSDGTNWTSAAPSGVSNLFFASGTLTNAQIKAINSTPVQLIASAGSGKVIHVLSTSFKLIYGGTNAFTGGTGLLLSYGSGTTTNVVGAPSGTSLVMGLAALRGTASNYTFSSVSASSGSPSLISGIAITLMENLGIFIWDDTSNPAGNAANNNTISWAISYLVETI